LHQLYRLLFIEFNKSFYIDGWGMALFGIMGQFEADHIGSLPDCAFTQSMKFLSYFIGFSCAFQVAEVSVSQVTAFFSSLARLLRCQLIFSELIHDELISRRFWKRLVSTIDESQLADQISHKDFGRHD